MAQVSHGTITVTDITDIEDVYFEYCLVKETTTVEELLDSNYFYNYFLTEDTTWDKSKLYYILINEEYIEVSQEVANPHANNLYERQLKDSNEIPWSTNYPVWIYPYQIWRRSVQKQEGIDELIYSEPFAENYLNGLNNQVQANNFEINSLQSKLQQIWTNLDSTLYPVGSYMASGIDNIEFVDSDSSTYGYNSFLQHSNIYFRYNDISLASMGQTGIILYHPPTQINNVLTQGNKSLELTSDGLQLYTPEEENVVNLNTEGLFIEKGGIVVGKTDSTTAGSIALSSSSFEREINGEKISNLRLAIGGFFAVDYEGKLYAKNAVIIGDIQVGSGSNVYTKEDVNAQNKSFISKNETINSDQLNMTDIANSNAISGKINTEISKQTKDFIQSDGTVTQSTLRALVTGIEINSTATEPYINIGAAANEGGTYKSYLHLTGTSINFVVDEADGVLNITSNGITTKDIHTDVIYMNSKNMEHCMGWIVRDNGHLSLKILNPGGAN